MNLGPYLSRRFLVALAAMAILFGLLVGASVRLLTSEGELGDSISEDMVWLGSQGQYEAVRFADTLSSFALGGVARQDLQLRLDLLISRISILEAGEPRRQLESLGYADEINAFRPVLDQARQSIQSLWPDEVVRIAELRSDIFPLAQSLRNFANAALLAERDRKASLRDQRRHILFQVLVTLVATMLAGLFVAAIVVQDHRNMATAEAALERERQISKLHRTFTSVVSHQFRTPLAIIDASAQRMMRRGSLMPHEEIAARAEKIRNACLRLTRLMESTLNAARLEEGEIGFTLRPTNLEELLRGVCDSQPEQDQNRIQLVLGGLPRWLEADATLLEQALQNLVSNALKYSPNRSPVNIEARQAGAEILISVSDSGVGIPADEIGSLFQRFFRARTAEGIPGTGIGLSFVAQILALHNGRVDVKSAEGEGSTFTLRFPYRPTGTAETALPFANPEAAR